jgi:Sec-independent protein secretion pathway component TatC
MLISMIPLIILFEGSLIMARIFGRPSEPEPGSDVAVSEQS